MNPPRRKPRSIGAVLNKENEKEAGFYSVHIPGGVCGLIGAEGRKNLFLVPRYRNSRTSTAATSRPEEGNSDDQEHSINVPDQPRPRLARGVRKHDA
jgi:hypothetical protein